MSLFKSLRGGRRAESPSSEDDLKGKDEQIDSILATADYLVRELQAEVAQASERLRSSRAGGNHGAG
jgi:hypothetical protein